ncbi:hypothetical protein NQ314_012899 [Rhamnusium bicolor]|uniref:Uncharacterized protein n=1 Tax=Rhamnusium bicolor TaxID=1586634 RepID=A0AAV8XBC5_9CUCU|nr:hypothetical protein NQ314_012899 [Rhamnusium bicolor]
MAPSEIVCAGVSLVASLLLCELDKICKEKRDKEAYKNHLRMTPEKFDELLSIVGPKIQKQSTGSQYQPELNLRSHCAI